jgi:hypothetical protein
MDVPDVGPIAYSRDPMIQSKVNNVAATFSVQSVFFFFLWLTGIWHQLVVCNWRTFTIRHGEKSRRFVSSKKSFRREETRQENKLSKKPVRNVLV